MFRFTCTLEWLKSVCWVWQSNNPDDGIRPVNWTSSVWQLSSESFLFPFLSFPFPSLHFPSLNILSLSHPFPSLISFSILPFPSFPFPSCLFLSFPFSFLYHHFLSCPFPSFPSHPFLSFPFPSFLFPSLFPSLSNTLHLTSFPFLSFTFAFFPFPSLLFPSLPYFPLFPIPSSNFLSFPNSLFLSLFFPLPSLFPSLFYPFAFLALRPRSGPPEQHQTWISLFNSLSEDGAICWRMLTYADGVERVGRDHLIMHVSVCIYVCVPANTVRSTQVGPMFFFSKAKNETFLGCN